MEQDNLIVVWTKVAIAWGGIITTVTLSQWGIIAGIVAALVTAAFSGLQFYILWRDKIVKYRPNLHSRSTDSTGPVPL